MVGDSLEAYAKINYAKDTLSVKDLAVDTQAIEKAKFYRYNPFIYMISDKRLYLETWLGLLKALPFLWKGVALARANS